MIRVPVVTTDEVKEPHLRGLVGLVLVGHSHTDMVSSFMVGVLGHEQLLQCGSFEFRKLEPDDPLYPEADTIARAEELWP